MKELQALAESVENHPALNNKFYATWTTRKLNKDQLATFAINYLAFTNSFPKALASLIAKTDDPKIRCEYTKTLFSEMGDGNPHRIHSLLFENFYNDLVIHSGAHPAVMLPKLKETLSPLPETMEFTNGQLDLYSSNHAVAIGAQLALEWQAYTMIAKLYEGARNYISLWPNEIRFHESCEFFYAHIASAEKEHKHESLNAAQRIIELGESYQSIKVGFNQHLDLIEKFWNGIAKSLNR